MENVNEKLKEELFKCNTKVSFEETQILSNSLDLTYILSTMFAKEEKSKQVKNLKEKLMKDTKIKVAK